MKLMIVDDETATRNGILKYVHWMELGIEQIKAAGSGKEALSVCECWEPDIVISDIRMPDMDGVTLCGRLREILPACSLIFISGYADKENLIAAISLSAISFVEKPFSIGELEAAIGKAVKHCLTNHETAYLKSSLQCNLPVIEESVVRGMIRGELTEEVLDNCRILELPVTARTCYQVLIIETLEPAVIQAELLGAVLPWFEGEWERVLKCFQGKRELILILISEQKGCFLREAFHHTITEMVERLNHTMIPLFCAAGPVVCDISQVACSCKKAELMKDELFFVGYGHAMMYRKGAERGRTPEEIPGLSDMQEAIRAYDVPKACEWEQKLYRQMKKGRMCRVHTVKKLYFQLLYEVEQAAVKLLHQNVVRTGDEIWYQINSVETLEELHAYFLSETEKKLAPCREREGLSDTVFQVICQIRKEYPREDLDITTLAECVFLTPTYLSNLFKKETGFTIGQYITLIRIETAKHLLEDKSLKLYQVAERCGYSDQNYFAKIFKRVEGLNPSDFRRTRM